MHNFRILFNSHFVPKSHPFVGSSNSVTLFIVTSSKLTSFLRQNVTLFLETSSESLAPINWRQYNKRRPNKGQELTRVIGL